MLNDEWAIDFLHNKAPHISGGCFSQVYSSPTDPNWIIKRGANDGTRTYLEWCLHKQQIGEGMRGMPEIDFVVSLSRNATVFDRGGYYLAAMRKYDSMRGEFEGERHPANWWGANWFDVHKREGAPDYLVELIEQFQLETGVDANDVHHGNVMFDSRTGTVILTDPSSSGYRQMREFGTPNYHNPRPCSRIAAPEEFQLVG